MSHGMISLRSVYRGIQAMTDLATFFEHWRIWWGWWDFWLHLWTPSWHRGRGPYVSMGLGWLKVYRGY